MARTVGIGIQSFEKIITNHYFYIDKTSFIRDWWESGDDVTLITRPRRFGKTLCMDMLTRFFSAALNGQSHLFEQLSVWQDENYRHLQGTYPVISLSFATVKETDFEHARERILQLISGLYMDYYFLLESETISPPEKESFRENMNHADPAMSLHLLSRYLCRHYGKKVIILLDEYDTPLQEAYVHGYWRELTDFIRNLFNATFKTNPYMDRAIMTGITRVSKESVFSDLNHLEVVTTTSEKYASCFGFTEEEVFHALREYGLYEERHRVKDWYDGFTFGKKRDIYNPWSVLNYLDKKRLAPYWANTSSNSLADKLIREGSPAVKMIMEDLLNDRHLFCEIDEQIIFIGLDQDETAIWSLLLASGYLRVENYIMNEETGEDTYELALTNKEVAVMFRKMIRKWFAGPASVYNSFIKALLAGDEKEMNAYMNNVALATFSFFDSGNHPSASEPERFYHGFVLGLSVEMAGRFAITSNRESGFGRYDVMLEPLLPGDPAIILEFKVRDSESERSLEDTASEALAQIRRQSYKSALEAKGIDAAQIRAYGFAFEGKQTLIRGGTA